MNLRLLRSTRRFANLFLFNRLLSLLLVTAAMSSPAMAEDSYALGVGDRVSISVYGQDDLTTETEVSADGNINIPLLGRIQVLGLSTQAASDQIAYQLERGGYLQDPHVNLLISEYRSNTVAVLGQVSEPGRLVMTGPTSLTEALAMAGGINERGSERVVLLRVDGEGRQVRQEYNLRELLDSQAENHPAVHLQRGDTLYVPRADQFYVHGQVREPGTYPLDRPLNVMQALSMSGGFNATANTKGLVLYRQQSDGTVKEISVDLYEPIQEGDVLFVKESLF